MSEQNDSVQTGGKKQCVRLKKNGDRAVESRDTEVVDLWTRFNKDFRPDYALFVEGTCVHQGGLSKSECDVISAELTAAKVQAPVVKEATA